MYMFLLKINAATAHGRKMMLLPQARMVMFVWGAVPAEAATCNKLSLVGHENERGAYGTAG